MSLEFQATNWQLHPTVDPPAWLGKQVGNYAAQLLWQRGICTPEAVDSFLNPDAYTPTSAFEFGEEMHRCVARIKQARDRCEKVAIWGDFDADGITSTSVLWEGLGEFFPKHTQLVYYIPNRLVESHGLSVRGIDDLLDCNLIITCDNGSNNLKEIDYAKSRGIDVIVTDHHTLPSERPPVVAIVNPRYLENIHPLFHLSGVAVAYKVMEALYATMPEVPQQPLENLLDLVAIGLVADLVQLTGDCRYLAQRGIEVLKQKRRIGVKLLLDQCKKAGDRAIDISFGIAPRINSVSRIWGDVYKCVDLLTSKDLATCQELAKLAELANTQRKGLQKKVFEQAKARIAQIDLSTTGILMLEDPNWSVGILGLVAGQVAHEFGRPTILFNTEEGIAKGSARSLAGIDLYELIEDQEHLLNGFGGHPLALGLSLAIANLPVLKESLNQKFWSNYKATQINKLVIDLEVKISDLGQDLFRELKQLEPYGMGNPAPKLLIKDCHFEEKFNANIKNIKNQKVEYIKSEFLLVDITGEIRGDWWGHYSYEIPDDACDVVVELVDNSYKRSYEVRIIEIWDRSQTSNQQQLPNSEPPSSLSTNLSTNLSTKIIDCRGKDTPISANFFACEQCPTSWQEISLLIEQSQAQKLDVALIYPPPDQIDVMQVWQTLVGIAKYLSRTEGSIALPQLQQKLNISELAVLETGLQALKDCGWEITKLDSGAIAMHYGSDTELSTLNPQTLVAARQRFTNAVKELVFRQKYFDQQILNLNL